jgi:hypothetical protein
VPWTGGVMGTAPRAEGQRSAVFCSSAWPPQPCAPVQDGPTPLARLLAAGHRPSTKPLARPPQRSASVGGCFPLGTAPFPPRHRRHLPAGDVDDRPRRADDLIRGGGGRAVASVGDTGAEPGARREGRGHPRGPSLAQGQKVRAASHGNWYPEGVLARCACCCLCLDDTGRVALVVIPARTALFNAPEQCKFAWAPSRHTHHAPAARTPRDGGPCLLGRGRPRRADTGASRARGGRPVQPLRQASARDRRDPARARRAVRHEI